MEKVKKQNRLVGRAQSEAGPGHPALRDRRFHSKRARRMRIVKGTHVGPVLVQCAASVRVAQGHEELSLLPERVPSEGPRSTAAVKSSSRPYLAEH